MLSSRGRTPAIIHSPNGLAIPRLSGVYFESHTLALARCTMKADKHVLLALRSKHAKQSREGQWKRKIVKQDVVCWKENVEIAKEAADSFKWKKV